MNINIDEKKLYIVDIHSHDYMLLYPDSCTNVYLFWDKNELLILFIMK